MQPSLRVQNVQSPIIPVIAGLIQQYPGTISLGQGVVHYGPPTEALAGIDAFLDDGENHKYKAVHGIASLRETIARKLTRENGIDAPLGQSIMVTAGGNSAFLVALLAIADPGDEVILPTPFYFNHEMAITLATCKPVLVPTDVHYQLDLEAIGKAITRRTRAIVTVSPNNPTGAVYSESSLRAVNQLCRKRGIYHISDEAYEYFVYGSARHFSPGSLPGSATHTISLYSLSKAYGFASWRIGYMVLPESLFAQAMKIQDTLLICPPVVSQFAAVGALEAGADYCRMFLPGMQEVRETVLRELTKIEDICDVPKSEGAFYFLLRVKSDWNSLALAKRLVSDHGVAVIPGEAFGATDGCYLRVAYGALRKETVLDGMERLVRGLECLVKRLT